MNFICKPSKIQIYINTGYYTLAQIKNKTGCDAVINGGLFNMSTFKAICHLRADGITYSKESWSRDGLAWNGADNIVMDAALNMEKYSNFIDCVDMVKNGKSVNLSYDKAMGGSRQRTGFGVFEDGRVWMFAQQSPTLTPEQLRTKALEAGVKHAIMLDGGGSTQCIFPDGKLTSARKVQNVICVWVGSNSGTNTQPDINLETRPTSTLRKGAIGSDVKWVQNRLVKLGYEVANDGIYADATYNAVKKFQTYWSLDADGIFGPASLNRMSKAIELLESSNKLISTPVKYVGVSEPNGDDDIIRSYNQLAKTSFSYSTSWCQMFAVMMQVYAGMSPYVTASCTTARNYYKTKGLWMNSPKPGYLIYFDWDKSGDCDHVGIVVSVDGNRIGVIEGNSSTKTYDAVCYKEYTIGYNKIAGYANVQGTPTTVVDEPKEPATSNNQAKIMTFQKYLNNKIGANLKVDGVYGQNTRTAALKVYQKFLNDNYKAGLVVDGVWGSRTKAAAKNIKIGDSDTSVWVLQGMLYCRGYDPKYFDGQFGAATKQAVIDFQKDNKLTADGIIGPIGLEHLFA